MLLMYNAALDANVGDAVDDDSPADTKLMMEVLLIPMLMLLLMMTVLLIPMLMLLLMMTVLLIPILMMLLNTEHW